MCQVLDLGVYLNRCFDGKGRFSASVYRRLRQGLPDEPLREYLRALREAEAGRPNGTGTGDWRAVRAYRRSVLELSLRLLFRLAELTPRPVLVPLTFLIQLLDDILDHRIDRRLGLPTLITAGGPSAGQHADELWSELKGHRQAVDRPFVVLGFPVYLAARTAARLWL
jgi:hypothetical protein